MLLSLSPSKALCTLEQSTAVHRGAAVEEDEVDGSV